MKERKQLENVKDIEKETLKPVTKVKSEKDTELQKWEVESTGGGMGAGGGGVNITITKFLEDTSSGLDCLHEL